MTAQPEITWTPVPAGARTVRVDLDTAVAYRLAVHISPRVTGLDRSARLEEFPDFLDWRPMGLTARVGINKDTYEARQVSTPDRGLWQAIFSADTPVRSGDFQDFSDRRIRTLASSNLQAFLRDRWGRAAVEFPADHPDPDTLAGDDWFGPLVFARDVEGQSRRLDAEQSIGQALDAGGSVPPRAPLASSSSITTDVVEALQFHEPRGTTKPFGVEPPDPDFHELVAFLGNHPALLRRLGLVIDFEFRVPRGGLSGPMAVTFTPTDRSDRSIRNLTPTVAALAGGDTFAPRPRSNGDLTESGYLRLDDTARFGVVQVDTDGATLNAVSFAQLVHSRSTNPDVDETAALPALRSGGVALARPGQAAALAARLDGATQLRRRLESGRSALLYADDLLRGWRMDVHNTATGRWHPLCDQDATYSFERLGRPIEVRQEGVITLAPTTSTDGPDDGDLFLQETLARWAGWSLVAERPGAGISHDPDDPVERVEHKPLDRYPVTATYRVPPGSLPALRFAKSLATGHACRYRLRARAVTICGDSVAFDPVGSDQHATPPFDYLRFEPVGSPVVTLRDPRTAGETAERIVLRSNFDTAPSATPARHILPPRVSQLLVEQHGAVDRETMHVPERRIGPNPAQYATLAALDAQNLATIPDGVQSPDERQGVKHFPVDRLTVPYLVDPLADGIALRGVPAIGGAVDDVFVTWAEVGASWPDFQSIRIELAQGPAKPVFDPTTGVLTISLPKALSAEVRLSSMIDVTKVETLGMWDWAQQAGATFGAAEVASGAHWMFTPFRALTLVHAVRQPLAEPQIRDLVVDRRGGTTFFPMQGGLFFDQASTGHVTIHAEWDEYVDAGPGAPTPTLDGSDAQTRYATPVEAPGDGPPPTNAEWTVDLDDRHEFGDTRHRRVSYTPEAVTRFAEYFVERDTFPASAGELLVLDSNGLVPGFVSATSPDRATAYTAGTDFTVDHDTGTVDLQPPGTTIETGRDVEVSWLARPATRMGVSPRTIDVPSSARPRMPDVIDVVPTFQWTRNPSTNRREGRGLRVLLRRPWWSSGKDERLATVVLAAPPTSPDLDPAVAPYVTRWGADPVYASTSLPTTHPDTTSFPAAAFTVSDLESDEVSGGLLAAAVHDVHFDADRDLWFSDVVVDTEDAYVPWIRLALARYQPFSVEGLELSPIATVDLMQLPADRTLTVNRTTGTVTLVGPSYQDTEAGPGPGTARAIIEVRAVGSGELAWETSDSVELIGTVLPTGTARWTATLALPTSTEKNEYRLTLLQYEVHQDRDLRQVERPVHHDVMPL